MNIAIRTDASNRIGIGHLTRCRTLAESLRAHGAVVHFICRQHPGNQIQTLQDEGYSVSQLPEGKEKSTTDEDYAAWLGVSQDQDADETSAVLNTLTKSSKQAKWDWLIVDHYGLDKAWEQRLRSVSKQILVIDDLANREHDCDILLDQNFGSSAARYAGLVPQHCKQLHGPEYALLKPVYAEHRMLLPVRDGEVRRVLIYFGSGTDAADLTGMAFRAFQDLKLESIALDVVVGSAYAHQDSLEQAVAKRGNAIIHRQLPDLASLMANTDLAIGAGGATMWERCCVGLPSMVISIADNQLPSCKALAQVGLIHYLGDASSVTLRRIQLALKELLKDSKKLCFLSESSMSLVDGNGVARTKERMRSW